MFRSLTFMLPIGIAIAAAAWSGQAQQFVDHTLVAAPGTATVEPGTTIPAFLFNGQLPAPVISGTVGQTLRVRYINQLPDTSSIHFHGLAMPAGMDGVIGVSRPGVASTQEFNYEIPLTHSGTYWYHPHVEDQMTSGLYGAIIVHPQNSADDPQSDVDQIVILHDQTTAAGGMLGGRMNGTAPGFSAHLLNGSTSVGQTPIQIQSGQRLRLRLINAAAHTSYVVALDGHQLEVSHADGHRVQPILTSAIPIGPGERYDAIVTANNPGVWSLAAADITNRNQVLVRGILQYAGSTGPLPAPGFVPGALATGVLLSYGQLAAFIPTVPITASPNRVHSLSLAMSMAPGGMSFTINGQAWPNVTPLAAAFGESVQFNFTNTGGMMGGGFRHPMHLHGHFMRLMGTAGGVTAPPIKDTILIRPVGQPWSSASAQIIADNPGRWALHCHDVDHMAMGMMTVVSYGGDADSDGLPNSLDWSPNLVEAAVAIAESISAFTIGGSGFVTVQATSGSYVDLFAGLPSTSPLTVSPFGVIFLDILAMPPVHLGTIPTGGNSAALFPYGIPFNPSLLGLRIGLQAVVASPAIPIARLSQWQPLTIQ